MDHKTASTVVRQLIGLIDPWGDHNSGHRLPTSSSSNQQHGDRQMYLSREHVDMAEDEVGGTNYTTTTDDLGDVGFGFEEDPDAEEAVDFLSRSPDMSVWHTMGFIMGFFFFILCILVIKDGILKYFGIDCGVDGGGGGDRPILPHNSQRPLEAINDDDEAGLTPEEIKERRLEKQRMERRLWYSYYLKPYITVLTADHFRTTDDGKQDQQIEEMEEGTSKDQRQETTNAPPQTSSSGAVCVVDMDDGTETSSTARDEEAAIELFPRKKEDNLLVCKPVGSTLTSEGEEELFSTKYMTLWDAHDTTFRKVEANCSICMLDYEEGDTIVKSGADEEEEYCIHVFHLECMLQWLSHGKKRCPICRHWFVPAQRIKEQMKNAHVVTRASLHHLYDSRTMQDIVSLSGDDEDTTSSSHSMSQSFNSNDTPDVVGHDNAHHSASSTTATEQEQPNQTQSATTDTPLQQPELPTSASTQVQGKDPYIDPESGQPHVLGHSSSC